ncbi:hypothetical protein [Paenibacillus cymbidii]|uniref:hypothetical protein n=1 Tax=Paenibacillus cymbidii TaxID=1639034 RepID=UPI00107FEDD4|nr:hypothetical protein [Paenibacillus cymbidii]
MDFRLPTKEGEPRDTSAGSIAAAGLLKLAEPDDAALFRAAAKRIVGSLFAHYATVGSPEEQGLLREAAGFRSRHVEVNVYFAKRSHGERSCSANVGAPSTHVQLCMASVQLVNNPETQPCASPGMP